MSDNCKPTDCAGCSSNCSTREQRNTGMYAAPHELSRIKHVIGVVSGKGGVGKSLVTSMLAVLMQRRQYKTAILDADITGPSIPTAFGINEKATGSAMGIMPVRTKMGIEIMSLNVLLDNHSDPVLWRGPILAGSVKQFWTDVVWNDVDIMFLDMPPGTGDVALTVFQSIPLDGIIVVTTPQDLVSMIVEKALNMAEKMHIPVLGMVENMSYVKCPDCSKEIRVFGDSKMERFTASHGISNFARIPLDPEITHLSDRGMIELFEGQWLDKFADTIEEIIRR